MARWPSLWRRGRGASAPDPEIKALAEALGITQKRVLEEYKRIAFASLKPFITWTEEGVMVLTVPENSDDADLAAVAELIEDAKGKKPYRIKLHDKRPALDALGRVLGLLKTTGAHDEDLASAEDPREKILRELVRIRAEERGRKSAPEPQS